MAGAKKWERVWAVALREQEVGAVGVQVEVVGAVVVVVSLVVVEVLVAVAAAEAGRQSIHPSRVKKYSVIANSFSDKDQRLFRNSTGKKIKPQSGLQHSNLQSA